MGSVRSRIGTKSWTKNLFARFNRVSAVQVIRLKRVGVFCGQSSVEYISEELFSGMSQLSVHTEGFNQWAVTVSKRVDAVETRGVFRGKGLRCSEIRDCGTHFIFSVDGRVLPAASGATPSEAKIS